MLELIDRPLGLAIPPLPGGASSCSRSRPWRWSAWVWRAACCTAGSGCAEVSLEKSLELYVQAGFDFLAISDHMTVTEPQDGRLVLLAGVEWHCEAGLHTGIYAEDADVVRPATTITDHQELLDTA